ncbi:cyclic nucleotide-binding domain-containing protein [Tropicimonas marinistellae]|uniref:cyclic nucleotide-binding domain-containing protein n=1 Tax=Tropicimonas marinistellae TaxID=1739787 RepID=UPI00082FFDD3|nr:cyclic nucleotide-binding domain-containing protein [Tropicimonas marinistellae]
MAQYSIPKLLADHPVLGRFRCEARESLAGSASSRHFGAGEIVQRVGDPADHVYILRRGEVAIEISAAHLAPMIVETVHSGDILGWGWLIPPYRSMYDARAMSEVSCVSLDSACLRACCDDNPALGYELVKHWLPHLAARFKAQRSQLVELYGAGVQ